MTCLLLSPMFKMLKYCSTYNHFNETWTELCLLNTRDFFTFKTSNLYPPLPLLQLWRVSASEFQFRTFQGQFLTCDGQGCSATVQSPRNSETFFVERKGNRVHLKLKNGAYLQVSYFISLLYFRFKYGLFYFSFCVHSCLVSLFFRNKNQNTEKVSEKITENFGRIAKVAMSEPASKIL